MMNVRKITTSSTGIVQKMRLTMNLSIEPPYPGSSIAEQGRGRCGPVLVR
jgi:hypothetical protein